MDGTIDKKTTNEDEKFGYDKIKRKPFLRQLFICSGVWMSFFVYGLSVGAPTVFIPQIRREGNSNETLSNEMASWLTSAIGFSGFPCVFILSLLTRLIGRKLSFLVACTVSLIAFIIFFCSISVIQILISEIIQGFFSAAQVVISVMILTEYTSPKYRGLFLTIKSATFYWGIWAANALGTFFHWKKIGIMGILCSAYTLVTIFVWPESPYWLASKERYEECAASHRWLKGCDGDSEKELESLISTQKEYIKSNRREKLSKIQTVKDMYSTIVSKDFYKPTLISILTGLLSVFSGKLVCAVYAIDIIKKITDSESTAYTGMLILDGITVFSMYLGCVLSKFLKRRLLLLAASSIGVLFLFILSLYLYLIHLSIISENKYVSVCLLVLFSIAVSCGPLIMSTAVYGELIPLRSRNLAVCIIAVLSKLSFGVILKIAPSIFKAFGLHGTFLFFGITSSVCIILLYKYLPETKDKTLQEIADSINGVISSNSFEEATTLVISKNGVPNKRQPVFS